VINYSDGDSRHLETWFMSCFDSVTTLVCLVLDLSMTSRSRLDLVSCLYSFCPPAASTPVERMFSQSVLRYDAIQLTVFSCVQKLTSSQLKLPRGTKKQK